MEGFRIEVVGVDVRKWSEAECSGSEDSSAKCNGDRGSKETRWDVQPIYD